VSPFFRLISGRATLASSCPGRLSNCFYKSFRSLASLHLSVFLGGLPSFGAFYGFASQKRGPRDTCVFPKRLINTRDRPGLLAICAAGFPPGFPELWEKSVLSFGVFTLNRWSQPVGDCFHSFYVRIATLLRFPLNRLLRNLGHKTR